MLGSFREDLRFECRSRKGQRDDLEKRGEKTEGGGGGGGSGGKKKIQSKTSFFCGVKLELDLMDGWRDGCESISAAREAITGIYACTRRFCPLLSLTSKSTTYHE